MAQSRYLNTDLIDDHFGTWQSVDTKKLAKVDGFLYTVLRSDRLDQLAYKNYKDGRLWWVIALVNGIKFEFTDMKIGEQILIPFNPDDVFDILEAA